MKVTELTKDDFFKRVYNYEANPGEWKFEGNRPCIVDFFATWCGPCRGFAPTFDAMAEEYGDRIDFYKVDVDKSEEVSDKFDIQTVPTLLVVRPGHDPEMFPGVMAKNELRKMIEEKLL